ncbi:MAG: S8 family serine peptidase [Psychromonas sp.]|nr:S8 family serine peptidase [Alteromonadales bacterium]MCP5078046.1 S8 family serine peptidase [Psychromonas sp.]
MQPDILQQKQKNAFNQQTPLKQLASQSASQTAMKAPFYLPDIFGATLWQSNKGQGVKVAVIDDGFDLSHAQFTQTKLIFSYDSESRSLDSPPKTAKDTHGTKVASILFATNEEGDLNRDQKVVKGMVPLADFIAIRQPDTWTSNTILSFQLAKLSNADVINCSWHSLWLLEPIYDVISDLARYGRSGKGTAVVFSAGNQGKKITPN